MKRTAPLLLAAVLACAMTCPALAADKAPATALYPAYVETYSEGIYTRLEKTYILNAWDDPADIPTGDFEREGYAYTLLDLTRQDNTVTESKTHVETVTVESKSKDMDAIMPLLSATLEVTTEDGYTGLLTLDTASIKTEASGYGSATRTVTATRSYPNLSDADLSLIPKTTEDNGRTLDLEDVKWQESDGFYNATATYTGTATSSYATGYTVTAEYTGEVFRTVGGAVTYTAVFSGAPVAQTEQNTGTEQAETPADTGQAGQTADTDTNESGNMTWVLALPAAALIVGTVVGGKYLLKQYKAKKEWREFNQ